MAHARQRRGRGARRNRRRPRHLPAENDPPPRRPRTRSGGGGGVDLRSDAGLRAHQRRLHLVGPSTAYGLALDVSLGAGFAAGFVAGFVSCFLDDLWLDDFFAAWAFDVSAVGAWPCIGDGCCAITTAGAARRASARSVRRIMPSYLQQGSRGPPWPASRLIPETFQLRHLTNRRCILQPSTQGGVGAGRRAPATAPCAGFAGAGTLGSHCPPG